MRLKRHGAALSIAVLVTALGGASGGIATAAGATRTGPDLSTVEAAKAYLISQGYDPTRFVFQVGLKNYAGASCPGLGWNCTKANLVVQIATAGGVNYANCAPSGRRCVIVQGGRVVGPVPLSGEGDMNMHGHCPTPDAFDNKEKRMMSKETDAGGGILFCEITQINPTTGNNHAVVGMSVHDNDGSTQFAQTDAEVTQETHGDGDNHAVVHEEIVLDTHDGSTQKQDGFQSLVLNQDVLPVMEGTTVVMPATGDNYGDVKETQKITQLGGSVQLQQTTERLGGDPCAGTSFDANSCVDFHQMTGTGRNTLIAHMDHNVAATAAGEGADQTQGCTSKECGLELSGEQLPLGSTNTVDDNQTIHYTLNGPDGTTQTQDPPMKNQGLQTGGPNDLWEVDQLAVLTASDPYALQGHINVVDDSSTGTVDADSVVIIDGARSEIVCNASSCDYMQVCGEFAEVEFSPFCPEFEDVSIPED
jgi:hypothetical protein